MEGTLLTWTRVERPPAGFAPGRVIVLVEVGGERRYAVWAGAGEPRIGATVAVDTSHDLWTAR